MYTLFLLYICGGGGGGMPMLIMYVMKKILYLPVMAEAPLPLQSPGQRVAGRQPASLQDDADGSGQRDSGG